MARRPPLALVVVAGLSVGALAVAAVVLLLPPGDEERIGDLLADALAAAERRDAEAILAHVDLSYADAGGTNRDGLRRFLTAALAGPPLRVEIVDRAIAVRGDAATVDLRITVRPADTPQTAAPTAHPLALKLGRFADGWRVVKSGTQP